MYNILYWLTIKSDVVGGGFFRWLFNSFVFCWHEEIKLHVLCETFLRLFLSLQCFDDEEEIDWTVRACSWDLSFCKTFKVAAVAIVVGVWWFALLAASASDCKVVVGVSFAMIGGLAGGVVSFVASLVSAAATTLECSPSLLSVVAVFSISLFFSSSVAAVDSIFFSPSSSSSSCFFSVDSTGSLSVVSPLVGGLLFSPLSGVFVVLLLSSIFELIVLIQHMIFN